MSINTVIDISHYQFNPDFVKAKEAGIVAVIHKATEGLSYVDRTYADRVQPTKEAGLLFGAYHFGNSGDGAMQADHFLRTVGDSTTFLVLDWESDAMPLAEAEKFVKRIQEKTGRWPMLYSYGPHLTKHVGTWKKNAVLANCALWCARYGAEPVWPKATWPILSMWQYTNGVVGNGKDPTFTPGIGACDRNIFYGSLDALKRLWGVAPATPPVVPPVTPTVEDEFTRSWTRIHNAKVYTEFTKPSDVLTADRLAVILCRLADAVKEGRL